MREFLTPSPQELGLVTSWEDTLATDFTVTCIDFETDRKGRPTEIGVVLFNLHLGSLSQAYWTRLTGESGCLVPHYPQLRPFLRDGILLAHNKATERKCLWTGLPIPPPPRLWLDSLNVFRSCLPRLRSYALGEITAHLGLTTQVNQSLTPHHDAANIGPHHALWDAAASGLILHHLLHFPEYQGITLRQLSHLRPKDGERPAIHPDERFAQLDTSS